MKRTVIQAPRTVDLAADAIRSRILDGGYPVGDRLPAERTLSAELGISRLTLRAALARLQSEGLVRPRQGSGVVVLDYELEAGVELLPHLLSHGQLDLLAPFLELRRAVAAEATAAACRNATDAELDTLEVLATTLAQCPRDELVEGNLQFAREVIRLARNLPMGLLFNTVARVYRARPDAIEAMLRNEAGVRASFSAIVALLRTRDPDLARRSVRQVLEHLDGVSP